MLSKPFSGKELFLQYEHEMGRLRINPDDPQSLDDEWDMIGKTKKYAWNNMAKIINSRMQGEQDGSANISP